MHLYLDKTKPVLEEVPSEQFAGFGGISWHTLYIINQAIPFYS